MGLPIGTEVTTVGLTDVRFNDLDCVTRTLMDPISQRIGVRFDDKKLDTKGVLRYNLKLVSARSYCVSSYFWFNVGNDVMIRVFYVRYHGWRQLEMCEHRCMLQCWIV